MTATLGPYEIRGRLGSGAMAVVWEAWDPKLEREVAIKEPEASASIPAHMLAELGERFVQEGRTAARLSHPGIVTIYAADVFDGRSAIVMELLRGHSLDSIIDAGGLSFDASLSILDQLLDALDYAHSMGVVHRDVKPDNVLVTDDGRVKLTDFGVAHVARLESGQDGIIAGTPGYMAPEQIHGVGVDKRSDVFGLGALAYEMLTRRNPFGVTDGLDPSTIQLVTLTGPQVSFDPRDRVPPAVQAVVLRALQRDPAARFASAGEMRWALRDAAANTATSGAQTPALGETYDGPAAHGGSAMATPSTRNAPLDHLPKKGSSGWTVGVAASVVIGALAVLAMLSAGGTVGFAILGLAGATIGATWWWQTREPGQSGAGDAQPFGSADNAAAVPDEVRLELRGPQEDRVVRVTLPCLIGRSGEADVGVADELVSRLHVRLEFRDDVVWVSDLGSRNGTLLDGQPLWDAQPVLLGGVVMIGSTEIRVRDIKGD